MSRSVRALLERGRGTSGGVEWVLERLGESGITRREDVEAIGRAMDELSRPARGEDAGEFVGLCMLSHQVKGEGARAFARERLGRRVARRVDELMSTAGVDERGALLMGLRALAGLGCGEASGLIARAAGCARTTLDHRWDGVFGEARGSGVAGRVVEALRQSLPRGHAGTAYLALCTALAEAGESLPHPYDSERGVRVLGEILREEQRESWGAARRAAGAVAHVRAGWRAGLRELAAGHPDGLVRLECAGGLARAGDAASVEAVRRACLDVNTSARACRLLHEAGLGGHIPGAARETGFRQMAEMCAWLAREEEFGETPDEAEMVDRRRLWWPPTRDEREVCLVRFTYIGRGVRGGDETGVGMVGSQTHSLAGEVTEGLSAAEVYGLYCWRELALAGDRRTPRVRDGGLGWALVESRG